MMAMVTSGATIRGSKPDGKGPSTASPQRKRRLKPKDMDMWFHAPTAAARPETFFATMSWSAASSDLRHFIALDLDARYCESSLLNVLNS
jgi:hypothetical protein